MDILKKCLLVGFVFLLSMLTSPKIFAVETNDSIAKEEVSATTGATQSADSVAATTCTDNKQIEENGETEETIAEAEDNSAWGKIVKFCKTSGIAGDRKSVV